MLKMGWIMLLLVVMLFSVMVLHGEETEPVQHFTANITLTSEYLYRGLAQTNHNPALQGGFDYSHNSGVYLGNWNSTSSWIADTGLGVSSSIELDLYGGFRGSRGDFSYDMGGLFYFFPGQYGAAWKALYHSPDTFELYAAVGFRWLTLKYSHALTGLFGIPDSSGSGYVELNVAVLVLERLTLVAHLGHQWVRGLAVADYLDWRLGLNYDLGWLTLALGYGGTDADQTFYCNPVNPHLGQDRVTFSITRTL